MGSPLLQKHYNGVLPSTHAAGLARPAFPGALSSLLIRPPIMVLGYET
jgi:hypothetical protein